MTWNLTRGLASWVLLTVVGTLIVLIPDEGPRLFSLSEGHGPSAQDSVGIVVILIGWLGFLVPLIRSRGQIDHQWRLGAAALAGGALLVWSTLTDAGIWWIGGALVLVAVQVVAAITVIRKKRPN